MNRKFIGKELSTRPISKAPIVHDPSIHYFIALFILQNLLSNVMYQPS